MRRLAVVLAFLAAPLSAQTYYTAATRPACTNNLPREIFIRDATAQSDCTTTGGGTFEAHCCCQDGAWAACATFGVAPSSSNSFETQDTPAGTDPVADSSSDTLTWLSGAAALTITGSAAADSITFDISGTASKCARFDGSGELVAASADCAAGDTDTGDNISVNGGAAADANFLDGDIDFTLVGASTPDDITATVNCSGCIDVTDIGADAVAASELADDAVTEGALKAVNAATDEYVLTYETTTGDFEWQVDAGSNGNRLQSWDNPPASAGTYDDEFNAGSLAGGWTIYSSGTTNPATSGTIDYTASLTTPIVDAATMLGNVAFQSDNSSAQSFGIYKTYSASTNATIFAKLSFETRDVGATSRNDIYVELSNSGDSNEQLRAGVGRNTGTVGFVGQVINNGASSSTIPGGLGNGAPGGAFYVIIWKKSDVYYFGYSLGGNAAFTYGGSLTKTGVTTFDRIGFLVRTGSEAPSNIETIDFIREKSSLDYSMVNP